MSSQDGEDGPTSEEVLLELPSRLTDVALETVLRRHYGQLHRRRPQRITFVLQDVIWCDILSLSLLTLWIRELAESGSGVRVVAPETPQVLRFLSDYGFVAFLGREAVAHSFPSAVAQSRVPAVAPYLPLTFFDQPGLNALLEDLLSRDRLAVILRDMAEADIVRSGAIRDVVIAELGMNFFDHARGASAHLLMTKIAPASAESAARAAEASVQDAHPAERPFFAALQGTGYLALVIGDKGPGIAETIREAYLSDAVVTQKSAEPTEAQLLRYAFLYHSTRRSPEERLGRIRRVIQGADVFPPPTGLYQLRKVVREYRGLLVTRTGHTRLVEDFLSDPNAVPRLPSDQLANFGGTQYKLCFPLTVPRARQYTLAFRPAAQGPEFYCAQLYPGPPAARPSNNEEAANALEGALETLERGRLRAHSEGKALLVDARGAEVLPAKAQHYLFLELMRRQEPPGQYSVVVNAPPTLPASMGEGAVRDRNCHPLLVFDGNWYPQLAGVEEQGSALFRELLERGYDASEGARAFGASHPEWFEYLRRPGGDGYAFRLAPEYVRDALGSAYRDYLVSALKNLAMGFFFPDAKVLLPSARYSHGYFDVHAFANSPTARPLLQAWLRYRLERAEPQLIVTIGETARRLVSSDQVREDARVQTIHIATPVRADLLFPLAPVAPGTSVAIVTDVIGTTDTLRQVYAYLRHANVKRTLAVVDATEQDGKSLFLDGSTYSLESVAKHPLKYHTDLPAGWHYDDVWQVDPHTHALIRPRPEPSADGNVPPHPGSLWRTAQPFLPLGGTPQGELEGNAFLEEAVIKGGAFLEGHYETGPTHMGYVFNIPRLVEDFGEDFANLISTDTKSYLSRIATAPTISQIAYPEYNLGLSDLATRVSRRLPGSVPVGLSQPVLDRSLTEAHRFGEAVLLLDDAIYSGDTIFKMLDLVESAGVTHVLVYGLIRRGSRLLTNRVQKLRQYNRATVAVRALAPVEVPLFRKSDCPLCTLLKRFEEVAGTLGDGPLAAAVTLELTELAWQGAVLACREAAASDSRGDPPAGQRLRFRWFLEQTDLPGPRNTLAAIVREHPQWPEPVLRLFEVLSRERATFLEDPDRRRLVFYPTFATDIRRAVGHFVGQLESLSDSAVRGVLGVLAAVDPTAFFASMPHLLAKSAQDDRVKWAVLRECFLTPAIRQSPQRVVSALTEAQSLMAVSSELVDQVVKYFETRIATQAGRAPLEEYRRLIGPVMHDMQKAALRLADDCKRDLNAVIAEWPVLNSNLSLALTDLRSFVRAIPPSPATNSLLERQQELQLNILEVAEFLREGAPVGVDALDSLKGRFNRIAALIDSPPPTAGLRQLLDQFRTNVFNGPLQTALRVAAAELQRGGIDVEVPAPLRAPIVFGDSYNLHIAFHNILQNVWEKSGARRLRVLVGLDDALGEVSVQCVDDGRGVGEKPKYKYGLEQVASVAGGYGGSFVLRDLRADEVESREGFRTLALLKLVYQPEVQGDDASRARTN